jgi:hypothetical protein
MKTLLEHWSPIHEFFHSKDGNVSPFIAWPGSFRCARVKLFVVICLMRKTTSGGGKDRDHLSPNCELKVISMAVFIHNFPNNEGNMYHFLELDEI